MRCSLTLFLACSAPSSLGSLLAAQATPVQSRPLPIGATTASATTNDEGPAGIVPFVKGPNLSLATTSQHDSSDGWSSLLSPNFAWRFNRSFSADVGGTIYDYINVLVTGGTKAKPTYTNSTRHFVAGDTALNGHYEAHPSLLDYNLTFTLGIPTGDEADGLGAGQATYNFTNHFEKDFNIFSPDIEIGFGDSSALTGSRVRKDYTSVGKLANFQAGGSVDLPMHLNFEADAYEVLPLSSETLYSTTGKGKKKVTTATNEGVAEDNGFTTALDIPFNGPCHAFRLLQSQSAQSHRHRRLFLHLPAQSPAPSGDPLRLALIRQSPVIR